MTFLPRLARQSPATLRTVIAAACVLATTLSYAPARAAEDDAEIVVVSSRVGEGYSRTKRPDGTFEPETYAFGEGGLRSEGMHDPSIDGLRFNQVAHVIAHPLANQNYLPARDPKQTDLLIMVYWGVTPGTSGASTSVAYQNVQSAQPIMIPRSDSAPPPTGVSKAAMGTGQGKSGELSANLTLMNMQNAQRDLTNIRNAGILGYDEEMRKTQGLEITAMRWRRERLIEDLEDSRYYVVLMAYDFQLLWKEKKHKLVWETRYSIRGRGNEFDKQLEAMTQSAARYFGQTSGGLQRKEMPGGQVKMDEIKILKTEEEK